MAFLLLAPADRLAIDHRQLSQAAGEAPIDWFVPEHPELGGGLALSPLTVTARLVRGSQVNAFIIGRIRLDRTAELRDKLGASIGDAPELSDADLCLHAYAKCGMALTDHLHGDFSFALIDNLSREMICVRDHFGVRLLAWHRHGNAVWVAGAMRELVSLPSVQGSELNQAWITDFLARGATPDPSASVYASVQRVPPGHVLSLEESGLSVREYWSLRVDRPLIKKAGGDYLDEFHGRLNEAMRERLPAEGVGIMMSGGLDSTTLAAKAVELGGANYPVFARTWLAGDDDPEAVASKRVAEHLGLRHEIVGVIPLSFAPDWRERPSASAEPSMSVIGGSAVVEEAKRMRDKAQCWLYGEGPDNALTFEWKMYFKWLVRHRQWEILPQATVSYLRFKSMKEWGMTLRSPARRDQEDKGADGLLPWIRGGPPRSFGAGPSNEWRPRAHANLRSSLWPSLFESLDSNFASAPVDWRHPYMDLQFITFLLRSPPVPWARHKYLMRKAMSNALPAETLSRGKAVVRNNPINPLLRQSLSTGPTMSGAIEQFVDVDKMPDPLAPNADANALCRVAVLDHWLKTHDR